MPTPTDQSRLNDSLRGATVVDLGAARAARDANTSATAPYFTPSQMSVAAFIAVIVIILALRSAR